jgi:hypothetical protein
MGRRVDVDDLVGAAEIADRLGVSQSRVVYVWRERYDDFPAPVAQLRQALIWERDVAVWARATGRLD